MPKQEEPKKVKPGVWEYRGFVLEAHRSVDGKFSKMFGEIIYSWYPKGKPTASPRGAGGMDFCLNMIDALLAMPATPAPEIRKKGKR